MTHRVVGAEDEEENEGVQEIEVLIDNTIAKDVSTSTDDFLNLEKLHSCDGLSKGLKRQITNNIKKAAKTEKKPGSNSIDDSTIMTGYDVLEVVVPPFNPNTLVKLLEKSSVHYAAIKAKVDNIVGLGYTLVESNVIKRGLNKAKTQKEKDAIRDDLEIIREEVDEWLDGANSHDLFVETLKKVYMDYETIGWGCMEVGRTDDGKIGYIGHISAKSIRIRRKRDGYVQVSSNKAVFFRNFGDQETPSPLRQNDSTGRVNEIIYFKKYSPSNTYYGVPDIVAAQSALVGNTFASDYNLDYFQNKAVPRYLVLVKGGKLNKTQQKNIFQFFDTKLKGQNHRSLIIPLPEDTEKTKTSFEIKAIDSSIQDSSFTGYRKSNNEEILMAHRVPSHKTGQAAGTNVALAKELSRTFSEEVCDPERRVLELKLTKMLAEFTNAFYLKLNVGNLVDELTQSTIDTNNSKIGTRTRNELRARDGLNGIPGGDKTLADIEKTPQQKADDKANGNKDRERDQRRQESNTSNEIAGRESKGSGARSD